MFAIACIGKKVRFSYEILRVLQMTNFKNRSFPWGQGIVQINPNLVRSVPCEGRV